MFNNYLGSILRHGLTVAAGALGAIGVSEAQQAQFVAVNTEIVLAVLVYGIGQALSFLKEQRKSK